MLLRVYHTVKSSETQEIRTPDFMPQCLVKEFKGQTIRSHLISSHVYVNKSRCSMAMLPINSNIPSLSLRIKMQPYQPVLTSQLGVFETSIINIKRQNVSNNHTPGERIDRTGQDITRDPSQEGWNSI